MRIIYLYVLFIAGCGDHPVDLPGHLVPQGRNLGVNRELSLGSIDMRSRIARDDDAIGVCCEFYGQGLLCCCARRANVPILSPFISISSSPDGMLVRPKSAKIGPKNGHVGPPGTTTKKPLIIKLAAYADRIVISGYARARGD